ncbi:MAG: LysR substrate-binding domain-containing protein [Campylobacterota bacterium]|nr:LysR substrate-binding domain-containing protein [Campylobacterota bacterium]
MAEALDERFQIGASYTIGTHLLPGEPIETIHEQVNKRMKITIAPCDEIIKALKTNKLDLGFIESPIFDDELKYTLWQEDEMVLCTKKQLPSTLSKDDLQSCRLVSYEQGSTERKFIEDFLATQGVSLDDFHAISEVNNETAIIQSIKWSRPNALVNAVAIVSKLAIEYELKYNDLYASSINDQTISKKLYIVYKENSIQSKAIDEIIKELLAI